MMLKYCLLMRALFNSQLLFVSASSSVERSGLTKSNPEALLYDPDPIFSLDLLEYIKTSQYRGVRNDDSNPAALQSQCWFSNWV